MDTPKDAKGDARLTLVTDARTYFLICDTSEVAGNWFTRLQSEWTRVRRHMGDADPTADLLGTTKVD